MKYRVSVWLLLVLLTALPTLVYASDIGGAFADIFKAIEVLFKLIVGLIVVGGVIYLLVKKN
jgi:hypothetical protein